MMSFGVVVVIGVILIAGGVIAAVCLSNKD